MAFRALMTRRDESGAVTNAIETLEVEALPAAEVLVAVEWTGLNYKDGLALAGRPGVVKTYPHIAGVDFAGHVLESPDPRYRAGQRVILTGWRVGETWWGGFAEQARVKADWLVPLPETMSTREAMALGTAGLTAMLAVNRLRAEGLVAGNGPVVVTGAGGGVGSIATMLLARLGHEVEAVSGRPELATPLAGLGAARVIGRDAVLTNSGKGLDHERWAGAIDNVGGPMLGDLIKKMRRDSGVALVGNAGGAAFPGSVLPFILRGVSLYGIDSVLQPFDARMGAWDRLATLFSPAAYEPWVEEVRLAELPAAAARILNGGVRGRIICNPRA